MGINHFLFSLRFAEDFLCKHVTKKKPKNQKTQKTGENKMHSKEQGYSGLLADTIWYDRPKAGGPTRIHLANWSGERECHVNGSKGPREEPALHTATHPCRCNMPIPGETTATVSQLVGRGCCYLPVQTAWGKQALTSHFLSKKYGKESDLQFIFTWNNLTNLASLQHLLLTWSTT